MVTIMKALISRVEITVRRYFLLFHVGSETRTPYSQNEIPKTSA